MRRYETIWVVNGDLPDEEVHSAIDKFTNIITAQGGTLVKLEEWGRRKLAYKIAGTIRGFYLSADFVGQPALVKELERNYRIDDRVIRYLTFKKTDQVDMEAVQSEIAARAQEAKAPEAPPAEVPPAEVPPAEVPPAEEVQPEKEAITPPPEPPPAPEAPPEEAKEAEGEAATQAKEE